MSTTPRPPSPTSASSDRARVLEISRQIGSLGCWVSTVDVCEREQGGVDSLPLAESGLEVQPADGQAGRGSPGSGTPEPIKPAP